MDRVNSVKQQACQYLDMKGVILRIPRNMKKRPRRILRLRRTTLVMVRLIVLYWMVIDMQEAPQLPRDRYKGGKGRRNATADQ
jgi:hypothetical protein